MTKEFLSLDNAVKIAVREFGIDKTLARQEFMTLPLATRMET